MVFVHGLGGDAFGTWRHGNDDSTSWPHWLARDFPDLSVWSLGYAASPTKWARSLGWFSKDKRDAGHGMALPDRALQLLDFMVQRGLGERPLFFICHSLGGLVVKQILRTSSDAIDARPGKIFANTRAVLYLATPHSGAALASLGDHFRIVFGATVTLQDLREHDTHLRNLFNWYRNRTAGGIRTESYYELRSLKGIMIVNPTSAHPGVGADPVGLDEDHLSIAKPRDRDSQVCGAAAQLLRDYVLTPIPSVVSAAPAQPAPSVTVHIDASALAQPAKVPIPHELPPGAEEFFGRQVELELLTNRLRSGKNTAVVGPAGLGKTALAAKALLEVAGQTAGPANPFPDGIVFLDLYTSHGAANPAWDALANRLAGMAFMERSAARDRATAACLARRILLVIEGGEEADGLDGRPHIHEFLGVLSPQNRWLLLTRLATQATPAESVVLHDALQPEDAARLFDSLALGRVNRELRARALKLLEGHPLAITWAGNLLARDDDAPERLIGDWESENLPSLRDSTKAEHTLEWLLKRSVRGLGGPERQALEAAGLVAHAPFPVEVIDAVLSDSKADANSGRDVLKTLAHRSLLRRTKDDQWQFTHVLGYRFARKETGSDPVVRARLGRWLHNHLMAILGGEGIGGGSFSITRGLEHLSALLRADDDQILWDPLANAALYDFSIRLTDLGQLGSVKLVLAAVAGWMDRFPADKAQQPSWLRERSSLYDRQGNVLRDQGDLAGALAAYRESLQVSRRLAEADPSDAGWQRDLSVSQEKMGNVLRDQGDLAGALAAYRESLQVRRRLAEADPSNAGWQHDLSVSHNKMGDVLRDQGDLAGALAAYRESLQLIRRLAEADPSNARWQRDLSVSQDNVGSVLRDQGDLAGALAAYRESLQLIRRLAEADPSNAGWQRDLSVSHNKMGDVLRDQGDLAGALAAYRESLQLIRRLAEADPSNAGWQRDLSVSHNKMGDVLRDQGDLAGALAAYRASLQVSRRLAEADPSNAGWQRDLSFSLTQLALIHDRTGERDKALELAVESLRIDEGLAALDPTNATWQKDVRISRSLVARLRA